MKKLLVLSLTALCLVSCKTVKESVSGVKKAMGLKKGEVIERLGIIRIKSTRWERLDLITPDDVVREGFPDWTPEQFIQMLVEHYRIKPSQQFNRIEFGYVGGGTGEERG